MQEVEPKVSIMTEDDTFRILKRMTYDNAYKIYCDLYADKLNQAPGGYNDSFNKRFLELSNWTVEDFNLEFWKRHHESK